MKIAYNPKTAAAITADTAKNDDIIFDLKAQQVWAKGTLVSGSASHTHGLLHSDLTTTVKTDTDSWSLLNSAYNNGFLLKSIRIDSTHPEWLPYSYGSGIAFGGADTKGVISVSYSTPGITFAGGNGTAPKWRLSLSGSINASYALDTISSNASAGATHATTSHTISIAGTSASTLGGTITAKTIGAALTMEAPAAYATNADTVDNLHADSFVRKWYGVYGLANKFLSFTPNEKGWIKLEVADSDNGINGAYGIYVISWPFFSTGNTAQLTVLCIYTTNSSFIDALTVVQTTNNTFELYFKFRAAAAYATYTMYSSKSCTISSYEVTAVTEIPTTNAIKSSLAALTLHSSLSDTWTTSRTLTIGNTGKSVNGSADVTWSLSDIGAAASSHTHDYLVTNEATQDTLNSSYSNFRTLFKSGGNNFEGKPSGVDAFGLIQMRVAGGWSGLILYANGGDLYIRSAENAKITKDLVWKLILDSNNFKNYFTAGSNISLTDDNGKRKITATNTWRTVNVNSASISSNPLNLCSGNYIDVKNDNGKVTFDVNSTYANNWNDAYKWYNEITETNDTNTTIDKWQEIVDFLKGIKEGDILNTLLNSKLAITQLAAKSDISTIKNNALYWVDTKGNASGMTNSPFNSPFAMLSVTNYNKDTFSYRSRLAFNDLGEIKVALCHSEEAQNWKDTWHTVLTSKNSGIDTTKNSIKINDKSLTVSLSTHDHDSSYVKKSGDTMTGALNLPNYTWNKVGDDVAIGDCNAAGCLGIKGLTATPGLAFYNSSGTQLCELVVNNNIFQRVLGDNTYTILDTSSTYVTNGIRVFSRTDIGTSPNYDNPGVNGLFEIRASSEVTGETGTRPINGYGPFLNLKTPDNTAMLLIAGYNGSLLYRAKLAGNVTMAGTSWLKLLDTSNSSVSGHTITINGTKTTWQNTWRTVLVDGNSIGTATLNLKAGNGISLTNSSGTVTIANNGVQVIQHINNDINYPLVWSNLANTNNNWGQQLYKSWLDLYYNPKNMRLTVGGSIIAGGEIRANGFVHSGLYNSLYRASTETDTTKRAAAALEGAKNYYLTAGGTYKPINTVMSTVVATYSIDMAVTDEWKDITNFVGNVSTFINATGTYIVQIIASNVVYSGVMSWSTEKSTADSTDEIVLHRGGGGYTSTIYLRTKETSGNYMTMQISANKTLSSTTYKFNFQRIC